MTRFPRFHAAFPPSGDRVAFDSDRQKTLALNVPEEIAMEWHAFGFGAYGGGLLWTPMPDESHFDPAEWPILDGTGVEVLRTAFASACFWQGGRFLWLNALSGNAVEYPPNAIILFEVCLTEGRFREHVLHEQLFQKARQQLGDLTRDECFGFAPLPALGGAISEDYLTKVKMREYLSISAQSLGKSRV